MSVSEAIGSPTYNYDPRQAGSGGARTFRCDSGDVSTLVLALGESTLNLFGQDIPVESISVKPLECPDNDPERTDYISVVNLYGQWEVVANYGYPQGGSSDEDSRRQQVRQRNEDGSYLELSATTNVNPLFLEGQGLKWKFHDPDKVPFISKDGQYVYIPTTNFELTWGDVFQPNWTGISSIIGSVNDTGLTVPLTNLVCPPETLLFSGFNANIRYSTKDSGFNQVLWKIGISLTYKNILGRPIWTATNTSTTSDGTTGKTIGWNHLYRTVVGKEGFEPAVFYTATTVGNVTTYTNGQPIYPLMSWSGMFVQATP